MLEVRGRKAPAMVCALDTLFFKWKFDFQVSLSKRGASTSVHRILFAIFNCQEDLYVFSLYFLATVSVNRPVSAFTWATTLGQITQEAAGLES